VNLCKELGARVVAEGIETIDELSCVRDLGVDYAQGYLLARPGTPPPQVAWPFEVAVSPPTPRFAPPASAARPATPARPPPLPTAPAPRLKPSKPPRVQGGGANGANGANGTAATARANATATATAKPTKRLIP
jgi:hypothetical protein